MNVADPSWWLERPWLTLTVVLGLALLVQTLRLWWERGRAARRMNRHRRLGAQGEIAAEKLLQQAGYRIVRRQASGSYQLRIDDDLKTIHVRADFIVEADARGGRSRLFSSGRGRGLYVAEVKAGFESAKLTQRSTRRQLLEYLVAFEVNGLLLVDTARGRISVVEFPQTDE